MTALNSLQHRTTLILATFLAEQLNLELCPPHTLEKLAQDEEMISSLSAERDRLEDKLKGVATREKLLIEKNTQIQVHLQEEREEWFNAALSLDKEVTYLKQLLGLCLCFSPLVLMVGFYLGKMAGA